MGLLHFQLFNTVQEKAVEEQMVATKDIVMEPTIKSLNDDLVMMNFLPSTYINTSHGALSSIETCNLTFLGLELFHVMSVTFWKLNQPALHYILSHALLISHMDFYRMYKDVFGVMYHNYMYSH